MICVCFSFPHLQEVTWARMWTQPRWPNWSSSWQTWLTSRCCNRWVREKGGRLEEVMSTEFKVLLPCTKHFNTLVIYCGKAYIICDKVMEDAMCTSGKLLIDHSSHFPVQKTRTSCPLALRGSNHVMLSCKLAIEIRNVCWHACSSTHAGVYSTLVSHCFSWWLGGSCSVEFSLPRVVTWHLIFHIELPCTLPVTHC